MRTCIFSRAVLSEVWQSTQDAEVGTKTTVMRLGERMVAPRRGQASMWALLLWPAGWGDSAVGGRQRQRCGQAYRSQRSRHHCTNEAARKGPEHLFRGGNTRSSLVSVSKHHSVAGIGMRLGSNARWEFERGDEARAPPTARKSAPSFDPS